MQPRNPITGEWGQERELKLGGLLRIARSYEETTVRTLPTGKKRILIERQVNPRQEIPWAIGAIAGASISNRLLENIND